MFDGKGSKKLSLNMTSRIMTAMQIVLNVTLFSGLYLLDEVYAISIKIKLFSGDHIPLMDY